MLIFQLQNENRQKVGLLSERYCAIFSENMEKISKYLKIRPKYLETGLNSEKVYLVVQERKYHPKIKHNIDKIENSQYFTKFHIRLHEIKACNSIRLLNGLI